MASLILLTLTVTCMFSLYPSIALDPKISLPRSENEDLELHSSGMSVTNNTHLQNYIVHVDLPYGKADSLPFQELESLYYSFLPSTIAYAQRRTRMIHCYRHVLSGFAARLTPEEVESVAKKEGFVSAAPENVYSLHSSRSPTFLGLQQNTGLWRDSNQGRGMIIGVLDTGIALNHPSFSGNGVPPPPARWRGRCDLPSTTCNNKLIGARTFFAGDTPADTNGHGSHVAGTAAGNFVSGANVFGQATGTASGIAPLAHLAIYKVCPGRDCPGNAILAGMDTAIGDGVDLISLSIGAGSTPFYNSELAIGTFSAIQRGIFVSCAAGNSGPTGASLSNEYPWALTVGASTIDRNIRATAVLGNWVELNGESLSQPNNFPSTTLLPLVYLGRTGNQQAAWCFANAFNNVNVRGMVVLCDDGGNIGRVAKGQNVRNAGGAAMILVNEEINGDSIPAEPHVLSTTLVSYRDGTTIKTYINTTPFPLATILFRGTVIGVNGAPEVASFSSRGPNQASPGILKPDIIGPGRNILAAWPFSVDGTTTRATFNIISGTSMACPHLSGTAALLKTMHPSWSPAAIKSAIMTTSTLFNNDGNPITNQNKQLANYYELGAGHVIPSSANDPGLVYDIQPDDYIRYLCGLGYTNQQVSTIARRSILCSPGFAIPEAQLNYPSFTIRLMSNFSQSFTRTVTNVGDAISSYTVTVIIPPQVNVVVTPNRLNFTGVNQQLTYTVTFSRAVATTGIFQGYLTWASSFRYAVRSQMSVTLAGDVGRF
ncbi:hypothetical protein LguiA_034226 [Lonicera macranthoides]